MSNLVQDWTEDLRRRIPDRVVAEDVRVGVFYTAVRLSTGHVGVAFTPRGLVDAVCCPRSAAAAPPAGRLAGQDAWQLVEYATSAVPLRRAVGVATLNALSSLAVDRFGTPQGVLLPGVDALEAAEVRADDRVAMVGAFTPFVRALKGRVAELWVVDRHPDALRDAERNLWRPPEQAEEILAAATVVLLTGSALVQGGASGPHHVSVACALLLPRGPRVGRHPGARRPAADARGGRRRFRVLLPGRRGEGGGNPAGRPPCAKSTLPGHPMLKRSRAVQGRPDWIRGLTALPRRG